MAKPANKSQARKRILSGYFYVKFGRFQGLYCVKVTAQGLFKA